MAAQRRDIQMFKRAERCRATVSKCSALGMEIKRQKVLASAVFLEQEDGSIQEKMDFEIRMGEGICKLLSASTQKDQLLNAAKSLVTCNARIAAYKSHLRNRNDASGTGAQVRAACTGKVAVSDIRVPLLWKNADHFSSKESSRRYAVFCLLKMGTSVFDTDLVVVDKTMTDITFERVAVFNGAGPDFEVTLEVYSCCCVEGPFSFNTPKKLVQKFRRSMGKSSGKKLESELKEVADDTGALFNPVRPGAKYSLLALTTLTLDSAEDSFRTHGLTVKGHEDSSFWLPLYGNVCCRVVAQPACMTEDVITGFLNQKQIVEDRCSLKRLFCVLRRGHLLCYYTPEEIEAKVDPSATVPINKETRIRAVDRDSQNITNSFSVINPVAGEASTHIFAADSKEDLQRWMEAFWQHFYDLSQWKHCSEELMKIGVSPRKPPLFSTKEASSVYHDMSIGSPLKFESLTDLIHDKIESTDGQFLIGSEAERAAPPWAVLFDGSHQRVFQKNASSPSLSAEKSLLGDESGQKRRAPPPPSDTSPYSSTSDKENICMDDAIACLSFNKQSPCHGRAPKGNLLVCERPEIQAKDIPVPFPRVRSLKGNKGLRSWQQSQV